MKRCMFADFTFKIPFEERIRLIKENGFDGVMLGFSDGLKYTQCDIVRNFGLEIENVHSQFDRINALWTICPESEYILQRTLECVRVCGENGVKTMICHPTDGLVPPEVSRFGSLDNVKFCYDTGHENCFSKHTDCLTKFGNKLACLHIHDNDGNTDGHMIPFDGSLNFEKFLRKLKNLDHQPPLSLELYMSKSTMYRNAAPDSFVRRAAEAAKQLEKLYDSI